jgi:hypothetical protein
MILIIFKYFDIFVFGINNLNFLYYTKEGRSTSKCCFLVQNILIASHFLFSIQIMTKTYNILPEKLHLRGGGGYPP